MTRERYERLIALFEAACERAADERPAFLDEECGGDTALRRDVERLLAADQQPGGLLEQPAMNPGSTLSAAQIGPYRIEDKVGEGGMGMVFRARDTKLNRVVAVKFLADDLADAAARRRFQREAQMASSLNHPHILTVFDAGEWENRQYLVTEYLEGGTLRDWAGAGKRSWREVVELLAGVADGLAAAHAAGILHRDVKPGNILIHGSGYAKLADFGLAKLTEERARGDAAPTRTEGPTRPGAVVGTIAYMSPEQASGKALDARSDVFSFGVVLYEALAGHGPFRGVSDLEVLQRIIHAPAEPLGEDVPAPLRAVVEKALEKSPADRYQSMAEMVVDLRRLARQSGDAPIAAAPKRRRWKPVAAVAALIVALAAAGLYGSRVASPPKVQSVAVLPLENRSGVAGEEFFSDGMTDELIGQLAQISSLHVISRTSAMRYKGGARKTTPEIARELNVDAIVEGSVTRAGNKVRITARLVRGRDDRHLWSQSYERELTDVLALQGEVARTIAGELRASLSAEERSRFAQARAVNPEAYEAVLQGNYFLHQNIRGIPKTLELFRRAIDVNPMYAEAHAGLAQALIFAGIYEFRPFAEAYEEARAAAQRALELDQSNAGAHNALADVKKGLDWDFAGAEQEHRRALELSPSRLLTRLWYAETLSRMERHDEALAESARAVRLDPVSAISHNNRSMLLWRARRYDEAIREAEIALELDPSHVNALWWQGLAYAGKGDYRRSLACLNKGYEVNRATVFLGPLGYVYGLAGEKQKAEGAMRELEAVAAKRYVSPANFAIIHAGLGNADAAFAWLEKAAAARDGRVHELVLPEFDRFRGDPRYRELRSRIGLR